MQLYRRISALLLILLALPLLRLPGWAQDATGFTASPVLPGNQTPGVGGYFDLVVEPGLVQDLDVRVENKTDREMTVAVEAITATTGGNGEVNYTSEGRADETMRHPFAELAAVRAPSITIPAGSSALATVTVTMPPEDFEGAILGSIQVRKELTEADYSDAGAIVNQYSYVMAVKLRSNDDPVEPDFALGDVTPGLTGGIASVVCDLRNTKPLLAREIAVDARVLPAAGGEPVLALQKENVSMAPNSIYPCTLEDAAGNGLAPGDYRAVIELTWQGRVWSFERAFTIAADAAEEINEGAHNQRPEPEAETLPSWAVWALLLALLVLIVAVIVIGVLVRRLRQNDDN